MADQEVENGGADEKVLTEAKSTVAASDHMFVLGVGGFEVIPILGVEAPKAEDAVQFYKAAFGAVEVHREAKPRRKEDLEQPLLHVLLQFGSGKVLVVDRLEDELKAQQNSTFQLVTEGDVEAVIDKVLAAGGNIAGGSYFGSSKLLVVNPLEDELKAQQLVAGDVEAVIKKDVGAGGITKGIGVDDDHAFLGKKYCGKVEDPYGVVWTFVGKNTIGGVREHVGGEVGEHGGEFGPPIRIVVVAPDKTLGDLVRRSIDVRMPDQFELTADLRNLQGLPSTMKSQIKLYQPVNVVIVDLDMVYDIRLRSGAAERRSIGELNSK